MEAQAKVVERWRYLRTLLIQQLDAFESGGLQMHADDVNVSPAAMVRLRKEIVEFDALIAQDDERLRAP
jgi:hypothetical protein